MKTLVLVSFAAVAAFPPGPSSRQAARDVDISPSVCSSGTGAAGCSGCKKKERGPIATQGANVSVAYSFSGRGRFGIRFKAGTCTDLQTGRCAETGCSIEPYTLTIKNTSPTRTLTVEDSRGGRSVHVAPGATTDVEFGDPTSGEHEVIGCGDDITLALSMLDASGATLAVREYRWKCTRCEGIASQVPDGGGEGSMQTPVAVATGEEAVSAR